MNPSTGGFISQDSYMGNSSDPASLHKYLYAGANPVVNWDPSGNMTLGDQMAAIDIGGILQVVARIDSLMRFYAKVNSAIDLVIGIRQLLIMFDGDLTASIPRTFPPRVDFEDAATKFVTNFAHASRVAGASWLAGYASDYARGKRMSAYIIYLPVLFPQPPSVYSTGIKINNHPVKVGLGAPGGAFGSLGGLGVFMGSEKMLYRMDIGLVKPGHTGGGYEVDNWSEAPFSFHAYNWHGGPR